MEVISFFSDNKDLIYYFDDFINKYNLLKLDVKDNDTSYFINYFTKKNEIYFHFQPINVEDEFQYNFSEEEKKIIMSYFEKDNICMFDIQYKNEFFVKKMLEDFKLYLLNFVKLNKCTVLINSYLNEFIIWQWDNNQWLK